MLLIMGSFNTFGFSLIVKFVFKLSRMNLTKLPELKPVHYFYLPFLSPKNDSWIESCFFMCRREFIIPRVPPLLLNITLLMYLFLRYLKAFGEIRLPAVWNVRTMYKYSSTSNSLTCYSSKFSLYLQLLSMTCSKNPLPIRVRENKICSSLSICL